MTQTDRLLQQSLPATQLGFDAINFSLILFYISAQGMSEDLFILLQSLVLTCQSTDTSTLPDLEGQLWGFLSTEEQSLLRALVKIYHN